MIDSDKKSDPEEDFVFRFVQNYLKIINDISIK